MKLGCKKAALIDITDVTYNVNERGRKFILPFLAIFFAAGFYHSFYGLIQSNWILRKKRVISQYSPFWKAVLLTGVIGGGFVMAAISGKFYNVKVSQPEVFKLLP